STSAAVRAVMVVIAPSGTIAVNTQGPLGRSFRNSPATVRPGPVWPVKPFTLMVGPVGPVKPTTRVLPISAGPVGPVRPFTPSMAILGAQASKRSRRQELLAGVFYSWDTGPWFGGFGMPARLARPKRGALLYGRAEHARRLAPAAGGVHSALSSS